MRAVLLSVLVLTLIASFVLCKPSSSKSKSSSSSRRTPTKRPSSRSKLYKNSKPSSKRPTARKSTSRKPSSRKSSSKKPSSSKSRKPTPRKKSVPRPKARPTSRAPTHAPIPKPRPTRPQKSNTPTPKPRPNKDTAPVPRPKPRPDRSTAPKTAPIPKPRPERPTTKPNPGKVNANMKNVKPEVKSAIENAAKKYGIPVEDFMRFAYIETGGKFDPNAYNKGSKAKGLFQFIPGTAKAYGITGKEFDPNVNAMAGAKLYAENQRALKKYGNMGPSDMYLAHQQGAAGYKSVMNAIETGNFSRKDTRRNIMSNISSKDFEKYTGKSYGSLSGMSDRELAQSFRDYWHSKFDAIDIE